MKRIVLSLMVLFFTGCSVFEKHKDITPEEIKEVIQEEVLTPENKLEAAEFILKESIKRTALVPGQKECIDALAGVKYAGIVRTIPNNFSVGLFLEAFSKPEEALQLIKKELAAGRSHMRINLLWDDAHKYGGKADEKFIDKWSKELGKVCDQYPGKLQIAAYTEHNISNPDQFLSKVKANALNCGRPVNSVWNGKLTNNPNYENEVHGSKNCPTNLKAPCAFSYDGTHAGDADVAKKIKDNSHATRFCIWFPADNLRFASKDGTSRPQRIKEAKARSPSKDLMAAQVVLLTYPKGQTSVPKSWIIKTFAEKHYAGDLRGDKLLFITTIRELKKNKKGYKPIIMKRNGKKVGSCPYYNTFDGIPGGQRYYCPQMGFKYGVTTTDIYFGGKKVGYFNPAFRDGSYRN